MIGTATTKLKPPIVLQQYKPHEVQLNSAELERLMSEAGRYIRVSRRVSQRRWELTAQNFVGTLTIGDQPFLIRPKIPPENVLTLLEVGLREKDWSADLFGYDQYAELLPAAVSWFARLVETTLGRGLLRAYRPEEERLVALRGRIDVTGLFRRPGLAIPVPCRFDEFTADILENRYLRAAIRKVRRVPGVQPVDQGRLQRGLARLEDVADVAVVPSAYDNISFSRLNQHYGPALRLARMMLENLTLVDRVGETRAASFLVDMNRVFEDFVAGRLRELLRNRLEVAAQARRHLGLDRKVAMRPDLVFRRENRDVYVGDTKYKLTDNAEARSSDYYQMLAYTTALDLEEGVLIYCRDVGGEPEGEVTVIHAGKRLMTYAVNLQGSTERIDRQMRQLADRIAERSLRSTALSARMSA